MFYGTRIFERVHLMFLLYNCFGMPGPNEARYSAVNEYQPVAIIPASMERLIAALLYINYCFVMAESALCSGSLHKIAP